MEEEWKSFQFHSTSVIVPNSTLNSTAISSSSSLKDHQMTSEETKILLNENSFQNSSLNESSSSSYYYSSPFLSVSLSSTSHSTTELDFEKIESRFEAKVDLKVKEEPSYEDDSKEDEGLVLQLMKGSDQHLSDFRILKEAFGDYFNAKYGKDKLKAKQRLYLFYKSYDFNIQSTMTHFKKYLKWREEHNVPRLERGEYDEEMQDILLHTRIAWIHGHDKLQRPSVVMIAGRHVPNRHNTSVAFRCAVIALEQAICNMPVHVTELCAIIDYKGFGYSNLDLPLTKLALETFQEHYPERLGDVFLINVPYVITMAWQLVKKWLSPKFIQKIHFISHMDELKDYFDSDQIPQVFGGTSQRGFAPFNSPIEWESKKCAIESL